MGFLEGDELPIEKYGKKQEKDGCIVLYFLSAIGKIR